MAQSSPTAQDRRLARLSQVLKTLRETVELETLLEATVPFLCRELGYSLVWFGIYDQTQGCLVGHDGQSPGSRPLFHQERFHLESGSLLEQVFVERRPAQVADLRAERNVGAWQAIADKVGIQGTLVFPLHYRNVSYGVALLGVAEWGRTPTPDEIAALSIVCGQLAVAIYQAELLKKEQQQKRPEEPLLRLLDLLRQQLTLQAQLDLIVDETHPFIQAHRTLLYWYDGDRRQFIPRAIRQAQGTHTSASVFSVPTLHVADCKRLYQTLKRDQILSISDTDSSVQSELSSYLQTQWQARSLLLAPIGSEEQLSGFAAVVKLTPHLWSDGEKRYLEGVAQLAQLIAPQEKIDQVLAMGRKDQQMISRLGHAVHRSQDWEELLRQTAEYCFTRLGINRLLLVQPTPDASGFSIVFQHQSQRCKRLAGPLASLDELDEALFKENPEGLVIEDWNSDLRLMRWRSQLHGKAGVQSLLICPAFSGSIESGTIVVTREQAKSWSRSDLALVKAVAEQLATVLHQRALNIEITQLQDLQQMVRWALSSLRQEKDPNRLDMLGVRAIAQLLGAPWATLLHWSPRDGVATVAASFASEKMAAFPAQFTLDTLQDPLIQQLLQSEDGLLIQSVNLVPAQSRRWLQSTSRKSMQQVILLTLAESSHEMPQGALLIAESKRRIWSTQVLDAAQLLIQQLAWSRYSTHRIQHLQERQTQFEQLSWYKQFCGERFQLSLSGILTRLQESDGTNLSLSGEQNIKRANQTLVDMGEVFQNEAWEFQTQTRKMSVISLLKQAKEQLDPKISEQQLWCQFHWAEVQQYQIQGETLKIAAVIQSVLAAACDRCLLGGRLDVWCRFQAEGMFELSVTDNGILDPLLLSALQPEADMNEPLVQSVLEVNPGLSLRLSQSLMERLGGSLELLPLQDGRTVSRLMIPGVLRT